MQFASIDFVQVICEKYGIALSMDGKGCWRDNVMIERFWRSLMYEEVYLHAHDDTSAAKSGIGKYVAFYNSSRPHAALEGRTPDAVYFTQSPRNIAAQFAESSTYKTGIAVQETGATSRNASCESTGLLFYCAVRPGSRPPRVQKFLARNSNHPC